MDSEHTHGESSRNEEIVSPPDSDIPQAELHFPIEVAKDMLPSTERDIPPRQMISVAILLLLIFGWQPLSTFGNEVISSVTIFPRLLESGIDRSVTLIRAENDQLSSLYSKAGQNITELGTRSSETLTVSGEVARAQLASLSLGIGKVGEMIRLFFGSVARWFKDLADNVVAKWALFLSGSTREERALSDAKAELKSQLRTELLGELPGTSTPPEGIIVLPKTGSADANRIRAAALEGIFSDQVIIETDETGKSGTIRPIFRSGVGQDYLYVMVPVKQ